MLGFVADHLAQRSIALARAGGSAYRVGFGQVLN